MTDVDPDQIAVNTFAGILLVVAGVGVLVVGRDLVYSTVFLLVGLFFLTRAFAQHRLSEADEREQ